MKEHFYNLFKEYSQTEEILSKMKKEPFFEDDERVKETHEKEIIDLELKQARIKVRIDLAFDILEA